MLTKKQAAKKGGDALKATIGGGIGYAFGRYGMYGGLAAIFFAPKEWKPAAIAAFAGGIAGAAQPSENPLIPDIMGNAKQFAAGGAKALFIDKIAPEVVAKLESGGTVQGLGNFFDNFYPDAASQLQQMATDPSESAIRLNQATSDLGTVSISAIRLEEAA